MNIEKVKFDCIHFKGYIPCTPNKKHNAVCDSCLHYEKISKKILIIKLGAIGDVIRTTPLLQKYRELYPTVEFTWITLYPTVLPQNEIAHIYKLDAVSILNVTNEKYDIAINLDKDREACILLSNVTADEKYGFTYENGHLSAATKNAEHKIITGLFDEISKVNTKSYLEEIFEICHQKFNFEDYKIRINENFTKQWELQFSEISDGKPIVGLNTGCGDRWKTRLWPSEKWINLIHLLQNAGYFVVLLGGTQEDEQNMIYKNETGAYYPGHFSLEEFIAITNNCPIIVSQVSLMMHIAIALQKQLILFNNIFNPHEFELYGRGMLMQPTSGCDCYFGNSCSREISCMHDINPQTVFENVNTLQKKLP